MTLFLCIAGVSLGQFVHERLVEKIGRRTDSKINLSEIAYYFLGSGSEQEQDDDRHDY